MNHITLTLTFYCATNTYNPDGLAPTGRQAICGRKLKNIRYHENHTLPWRHNGLDSVSNHQPHHCLLSRLFGRRSKKTSKLRVTGLCAWNSPGTGEFPAQRASYAENVSIWWRHHVDNAPKHIFPHISTTRFYNLNYFPSKILKMTGN